MSDDTKSVYVKCDCGCCVLEVSRHEWGEGDVDYDVCVLDSRYDHKANGVWNRIRRAAKALLGKPVYFNDVYLHGDEEFDALIEKLQGLRDS